MTSKEREDFAAPTNKAGTVREVWLREREEHLALHVPLMPGSGKAGQIPLKRQTQPGRMIE